MISREVFSAALRGDITAVKDWLAEGGDPNEAIEQAIIRHGICGFSFEPGSTLLMAAASAGHLDVVRRLVEAGADVNVALLRLRLLLARGRARHGPETTVVAARLFGSLSGFADVPNECFWRVVKYAWLGDWRHP